MRDMTSLNPLGMNVIISPVNSNNPERIMIFVNTIYAEKNKRSLLADSLNLRSPIPIAIEMRLDIRTNRNTFRGFVTEKIKG